MALIWLFLLGWAHVISGQFSPVEIAMTLIVGIASVAGLGMCLWRARWSLRGVALIVLFGILQCLAFRISLLPAIAHQ
jgi:multisubunit Na+/H+ antiporter MnhE subunit